MSNIIPFEFESLPVRVLDQAGEPWFVLADVCRVLGITNPSVAASQIDDDDRSTLSFSEGGPPKNIINESGLYSLIIRSNKPEAKSFKKWVTSEVLPSIRKTGQYQVAQKFNIPTTLSEALRLAADQAERIEEQQLLIEQQKPAVAFVERYVEARSAKSLREVAKVLGIKEREFINRLLREHIVFRQSGNLLPYAVYQHKGYFEVKTGESNGHAYQQTRFTPLGIEWISKRFGLITGNVSM